MRNVARVRYLFLIILILFPTGCRKLSEPPKPADQSTFLPCIILPGKSNTLEIVTFNVGSFPKNGYTSVIAVSSLLNTIDADVYALQEVTTISGFNQLIDLMPGYTGIFYPINNSDWNLAYIIKLNDFIIDYNSQKILFQDSQYFPRPPFEIRLKHKGSGKTIYLINNHLKCCGGNENEASRRNAALMLKEYVDSSHRGDAVIILGDLNDELTGAGSNENPFLVFINDPDNFLFTDMNIARGSLLWWSYPSYPSHIDHILVTDELFEAVDTTVVFKAAPCYSSYSSDISDHRPVGLILLPGLL